MTFDLHRMSPSDLIRLGGLKERCSAALVCSEHNISYPCEACASLALRSVACAACLKEFSDGVPGLGERVCFSGAMYKKTGRIAFEAQALAAEKKRVETERKRPIRPTEVSDKDRIQPEVDQPDTLARGARFGRRSGLAALAVAMAGGILLWYQLPAGKNGAPEQSHEDRKKTTRDEDEIERRLKAKMDANAQSPRRVIVPLDELTVELPSDGRRHFLSVKMVLSVADGKHETKVKEFLPLIRDRVLTVLSSRPTEQLSTVKGKDLMARECALVINAIIEPQLTAIYVLQQDATTADLRNLERIGVFAPSGRTQVEAAKDERTRDPAREAAAQFWKVTEMDLPIQAVTFTKFILD